MQSFELPEFYMPWPARLNPNLEGGRVHIKAWARQMGMLDSPQDAGSSKIGDERKFDAMDFALFAALTHPDAPASELDLLSDWYVWGWFVDDYFPQVYKDSSDFAGAKEFFSRLPEFMPVYPTSTPPEPTNPVEHGLADLWPRTAPTKSTEWRCRFSDNIRNISEEALRELSNLNQNKNRVLDPVEYIGMRRKVGGISWSADLVEYALGVEIPPEIYRTRPIRVLNETFADSAGLRDDIISYQRDVDEGKVNNGVVVVARFLDCDPQQAVDVVNDLVTSRLYQFENTVATELSPLFAEYRLRPSERENVLRYVNGLRDWMAGDLEWALRPSGPTGLGAAAARIGLSPTAIGLRPRSCENVPHQAAEPFELPEFYMPFSARLNPHLDTAREHGKAWMREMGMLDGRSLGVWDESRAASADPALFGALAHPDAPGPQLDLLNDWYAWGLIFDDFFLEVFKRRHDLAGAKVFVERLPAFMRADATATPLPTNPVERGLADLWSRTAPAISVELQRQLSDHVMVFAKGGLWELANLIQHRVPDPVDYVEMRRETFGAALITDMSRYAVSEEIPSEIYRTRAMGALATALADWAGLSNDIFSYQMETEFEGEINNSVLVFQRFLDCDLPQAFHAVNDLVTARLRQFEYIVVTELPAMFDEFDLDTRGREKLLEYVELLQDWMAGYVKWHLQTGRSKEFGCATPRWRSLSVGPPGGAQRLRVSDCCAESGAPAGAGEEGLDAVDASEPWAMLGR